MWGAAVLLAAVAAALAASLAAGGPRQRAPAPGTTPVVSEAPPAPRAWLPPVTATAAGLGVLAVLPGGPAGLLGAAVAAVLAHRWARAQEPSSARRRRTALEASVPLVVDLMAASLAAGASPVSAVRLVADAVEDPMREELRSVCALLALGGDPTEVWAGMAGHPQLGPLGRALLRASDSGASVSDALLRLSEELRERRRGDVEARARSVAVKATAPLGVCLLPAFVLLGVVPLIAGSVLGLVRF